MLDGAMTKLVIVLAVVIVVILVIVIIAARSMRAEDPEEFADRPRGRGPSRGGPDDRYERHPGRAGTNGRPAGRAGGAGRGFDQRREPRRRGYGADMQDGPGYEKDRGFDRGYSERRSAQSTGPQQRSRGNGRSGDGRPPRRPEESQAPASAQQARSRRSGDSSEWDSSEWEKLSDVDYWAELASDKSLKTTAQPAAQARSGPDRDTQALTRRSPSASAAPRQDPATGLPVRGRPQPAAAELAAPAVGRADFTPAPVPVSGIRNQSRAAAAAASGPHPVPHADPAGLPGPGRAQPAGRPRVDPDDDPLTSPSFPRIPADDSRSYRNGRADTPSRGSRVPAPYPATTQQFAGYSSPAPDHHGNGSRDTDPTYPNGYRHDPLLSRDPYAVSSAPPPSPRLPGPSPPQPRRPRGTRTAATSRPTARPRSRVTATTPARTRARPATATATATAPIRRRPCRARRASPPAAATGISSRRRQAAFPPTTRRVTTAALGSTPIRSAPAATGPITAMATQAVTPRPTRGPTRRAATRPGRRIQPGTLPWTRTGTMVTVVTQGTERLAADDSPGGRA